MLRTLLSGTAAGVVSVVVFAFVHELLISDIWFSLIPMMIAGAACGMSLAWSYRLMVQPTSLRSWIQYNLIYDVLFVILGVVSLVVYEPITTAAEVMATNEAPTELISLALPLSIAFTLAGTGLIGWLYGSSWRHYMAVLVTTTLLIFLLGINVSILGLVEIPVSAMYLVMEMFLLILALDVVYAAVFAGLELRAAVKS
jgi:hypothetical protein